MVEKRGKPRDERGERSPNGQLRRGVPANLRSEAQFQRMKEQAIILGLDPMMTSQAGRLFCCGLLTSRHMATIEYIAKVYAAYARHVGPEMMRRMRSPSYEPSTNRSERLDETFDQQSDALIAKAEFEQLQVLIPDQPREIREAIERICVDDQMIPTAWVGDLCRMLTMIEECRSGTRSHIKLTRGNLPLRRRTVKAVTRQEKFEKGAYVHVENPTVKADRLANLTGDALAAAARDREGLMRTIKAREAKRAEGAAP